MTGGFELALGCDILLGSTKARFRDTHCRFGIVSSSVSSSSRGCGGCGGTKLILIHVVNPRHRFACLLGAVPKTFFFSFFHAAHARRTPHTHARTLARTHARTHACTHERTHEYAYTTHTFTTHVSYIIPHMRRAIEKAPCWGLSQKLARIIGSHRASTDNLCFLSTLEHCTLPCRSQGCQTVSCPFRAMLT